MPDPLTYIIGDVGGHCAELLRGLLFAGADPDILVLPENVSIIQAGDLIDRGPESLATVQLARRAQLANSGRYIQLAGNHEINWLTSRRTFATASDPKAVSELHEWADAGGIYLAAYVDGPRQGCLVTHAGLTRGLWEDLIRPDSAKEAALRVNLAWNSDAYALIAQAGRILDGEVNLHAGVYWADAGFELYPSWSRGSVPFDQVHGHSSAYDWNTGARHAPADIMAMGRKDFARRHFIFEGNGARLVGVDPLLGKYAGVTWEPYLLKGRACVSGPALGRRAGPSDTSLLRLGY
jgi:hypothetical protein